MGTDFTMMRGLKIFRSGGAWELDDEKLIIIRDMAQEVLTDRKVPSAKVVHYIVETRLIGQGEAKKSLHLSACSSDMSSRITLTDDNSTEQLKYVSCANCKGTNAFKVASGLLSEDEVEKAHVHLTRYSGARYVACNSYWYADSDKITNATADVTCGSCKKTKEYISRSELAAIIEGV